MFPMRHNADIRRIRELEAAITKVVTQSADDVCWMDAYVMLGDLVGIKVTPESLAMLPTAKMLGNCGKFIDSLKGGAAYDQDFATQRIKQLEADAVEWRAIYNAVVRDLADRDRKIEEARKWETAPYP